ncbi:unnamed protein product [Effrenium voratum]|nr:unnamed protein product [Effrenium voratum]
MSCRRLVAVCLALLLNQCVASPCDRDYEGCPQGWQTVVNGTCFGPTSYAGQCSLQQAGWGSLRDDEKKVVENECNVIWPCKDRCLQDFAQPCPLFWSPINEGLCKAPSWYKGDCPDTLAVGNDVFSHQEMAVRCGLTWPCSSLCKSDFDQLCPTGWAVDDAATCHAPTKSPGQYTGPCETTVSFALESDKPAARKEFAERCGVDFCVKQSGLNDEPFQSSPCPAGWMAVGELVPHCYGSTYEGPCRPLISGSALASIGRKEFAAMCGVAWPRGDKPQPPDTRGQLAEPSVQGPVAEDGRVVGAQ